MTRHLSRFKRTKRSRQRQAELQQKLSCDDEDDANDENQLPNTATQSSSSLGSGSWASSSTTLNSSGLVPAPPSRPSSVASSSLDFFEMSRKQQQSDPLLLGSNSNKTASNHYDAAVAAAANTQGSTASAANTTATAFPVNANLFGTSNHFERMRQMLSSALLMPEQQRQIPLAPWDEASASSPATNHRRPHGRTATPAGSPRRSSNDAPGLLLPPPLPQSSSSSDLSSVDDGNNNCVSDNDLLSLRPTMSLDAPEHDNDDRLVPPPTTSPLPLSPTRSTTSTLRASMGRPANLISQESNSVVSDTVFEDDTRRSSPSRSIGERYPVQRRQKPKSPRGAAASRILGEEKKEEDEATSLPMSPLSSMSVREQLIHELRERQKKPGSWLGTVVPTRNEDDENDVAPDDVSARTSSDNSDASDARLERIFSDVLRSNNGDSTPSLVGGRNDDTIPVLAASPSRSPWARSSSWSKKVRGSSSSSNGSDRDSDAHHDGTDAERTRQVGLPVEAVNGARHDDVDPIASSRSNDAMVDAHLLTRESPHRAVEMPSPEHAALTTHLKSTPSWDRALRSDDESSHANNSVADFSTLNTSVDQVPVSKHITLHPETNDTTYATLHSDTIPPPSEKAERRDQDSSPVRAPVIKSPNSRDTTSGSVTCEAQLLRPATPLHIGDIVSAAPSPARKENDDSERVANADNTIPFEPFHHSATTEGGTSLAVPVLRSGAVFKTDSPQGEGDQRVHDAGADSNVDARASVTTSTARDNLILRTDLHSPGGGNADSDKHAANTDPEMNASVGSIGLKVTSALPDRVALPAAHNQDLRTDEAANSPLQTTEAYNQAPTSMGASQLGQAIKPMRSLHVETGPTPSTGSHQLPFPAQSALSTMTSPAAAPIQPASARLSQQRHSTPIVLFVSPRRSPPDVTGGRRAMGDILRIDLWSPDVQVVVQALQRLTLDAFYDAPARESLARAGGLFAVVQCMEQNMRHAAVQIAGCQAIEKLALDNDNEVSLGELGAVDMVFSSMMNHNDGKVQHAAWSALWNLTCQGAPCFAFDVNAPHLVSLLQRHLADAELVATASGTLANFCQDGDGTDDEHDMRAAQRRRSLIRANGLVVLSMAIQAHWKHAAVKREGGRAMAAILGTDYDER